MKSKTVLEILFLLSMIFVLYPRIDNLIDIQKVFDEYGASSELLRKRDNAILELIGIVFLYVVLAFGFNYIKIEQQEAFIETQESKPIEPKQAIKPKPPKVVKPLTNKTKNVIAVLSASVFMLVFVWQVFSNLSPVGTGFNTTMFFMEQALKSIIACISVGIIAYIIAKYH